MIKDYNTTDRAIIKANLKRLMIDYNIKAGDIISLGYKPNNVYAWTNKGSINIPMFDQSLSIAVNFDFDVKKFLENNWIFMLTIWKDSGTIKIMKQANYIIILKGD